MEKVTLQTPVKDTHGGHIIVVSLRAPTVGDLRGLKLVDLMQLDVKAIEKLLPRITEPSLLPEQVAALDLADFAALSGAISSFFATKADKEAFGLT